MTYCVHPFACTQPLRGCCRRLPVARFSKLGIQIPKPRHSNQPPPCYRTVHGMPLAVTTARTALYTSTVEKASPQNSNIPHPSVICSILPKLITHDSPHPLTPKFTSTARSTCSCWTITVMRPVDISGTALSELKHSAASLTYPWHVPFEMSSLLLA